MPYVDYMNQIIKNVEQTRRKRIDESQQGVHHPRIPQEEVDDFLTKYHPDYMAGTKRTISIGPSKGNIVTNEVADILEAGSMIDPEILDTSSPDYETDVFIIGGGGAGAAAALTAEQQGCSVLLSTKLRLGDANTMMAEGGIQGADKPQDSPVRHYLDTMGGGHFTNDPDLLETLTSDAPKALQWLEKQGVMFDKDENGVMKVLHGGGTSRKRMHSAGDMTGAAIMRVLRDEVKNKKDTIEVIEFSPVVELTTGTNGEVTGGIMYNMETGSYLTVKAKAVIITTGGFGRLHVQGFPTTNHYGATADGIVIAYRAGVPFRFMDSSQIHPTGIIYPEQNVGLLITEKVRGAGAQLLNAEGEQFVYPLEPRDVESSAIIRECGERANGVDTPTGRVGVWLDSPMLEILKGEGFVKANFPAKYRQFERHGIDIAKEPMLVYPTLHYQNGGLSIDSDGETPVKGLFAAGEVTGGIHGRNRLMGNSLLDIVVFGIRSGNKAAEYAAGTAFGTLTLDHLKKYSVELEAAGTGDGRIAPILLPDYRGKIG